MSWFKEVENILARQKEEQAAQERARKLTEEVREKERIRSWEVFERQTVKKLFDRWDELKTGSILRTVRDVVWPESSIDVRKIVLPFEVGVGKERYRHRYHVRWATWEIKEEKRSFFGSYWKESEITGWSCGELRDPEITPNLHELMKSTGLNAQEVENPYVEGRIYHTLTWESRDARDDEYTASKDVPDFTLRLFEKEARVGFKDLDDEFQFQFDEVSNADTFKGWIAQILKEKVSKI